MEKQNKSQKQKEPYLLMGFWEFAIIATLMVLFFPWSLLFCWFFLGLHTTTEICAILLHDAVKTLLAVLLVLAILSVIVIALSLLIIAIFPM